MMNLQYPQSVVQELEAYGQADMAIFLEVSERYFFLTHRKTFPLSIQSGLQALLELHSDVTTLTGYVLLHITPDQRKPYLKQQDLRLIMKCLEDLQNFLDLVGIPQKKDAESIRKVFLSMSKDLRVVVIALTYRFSSLFDLKNYSDETCRRIARETLEVYVPLAGRLGIYTLKRQLEDRSFAFLSGDDFRALQSAFDKRTELRQKTLQEIVEKMKAFLEENGISAQVSGRIKGLYSTYTKLKRRGGGTLDDISDLIALRVVLDNETDCYSVLSVINQHWLSVSGRFKDYIAMPKSNGYRSLHTTVLGMIPGSPRSVEIQIRTEEMHREAEYGVAAHWWYREAGVKRHEDAHEYQMKWMENLIELHESLRAEPQYSSLDFFSDTVFVMTLSGRVIELPKGATPLDFAYAISPTLGHHCSKVKVNGEVVSLDYELRTGDRVFIVKKMESTPNLYWLSLVTTKKAREAIQHFLFSEASQKQRSVSDRVLSENSPQSIQFGALKEQKKKIFVAGESTFTTKLAACCSPGISDEIVGYVTRGGFISVHRRSCRVLDCLDQQRCLEAWWSGQKKHFEEVRIEVVVKSAELLTSLSDLLHQHHVPLISFRHQVHPRGLLLIFVIKLEREQVLPKLIQDWKSIKGVVSVKEK